MNIFLCALKFEKITVWLSVAYNLKTTLFQFNTFYYLIFVADNSKLSQLQFSLFSALLLLLWCPSLRNLKNTQILARSSLLLRPNVEHLPTLEIVFPALFSIAMHRQYKMSQIVMHTSNVSMLLLVPNTFAQKWKLHPRHPILTFAWH